VLRAWLATGHFLKCLAGLELSCFALCSLSFSSHPYLSDSSPSASSALLSCGGGLEQASQQPCNILHLRGSANVMATEPTASSLLFFHSCLTALSSSGLGRKENNFKLVSDCSGAEAGS